MPYVWLLRSPEIKSGYNRQYAGSCSIRHGGGGRERRGVFGAVFLCFGGARLFLGLTPTQRMPLQLAKYIAPAGRPLHEQPPLPYVLPFSYVLISALEVLPREPIYWPC